MKTFDQKPLKYVGEDLQEKRRFPDACKIDEIDVDLFFLLLLGHFDTIQQKIPIK